MCGVGCKKTNYCSIMFTVAEGKEIEEKISNCYILRMSMPKPWKNTKGGDFDILHLPHGQVLTLGIDPGWEFLTINHSKCQNSPG